MDILKVFYTNDTQREAVKEFMLQCFNEWALEKVMKHEDTKDLANAREVVLQAFIKLREVYGEEPKPRISSSR